MFRTELVTRWEDLDAYRADWDRLWKRSDVCKQEFYCYDWMSTVARKLSGSRDHPWCLIGREDGEVTGIAPFFFQRARVTRLNLPFSQIGFFPNDFIHRHGLLVEGDPEPLWEAVVAQSLGRKKADLLVLNGLPEKNGRKLFCSSVVENWRRSLLQVNSARGGRPGTASVDMCAIDLSPSWDRYLQTRKGKLRRNLARRWRLAADLGRLSLWRTSAGAQVCGEERTLAELVAWIHHIDRNSWKIEKGYQLGNLGYDYVEFLLSIAFDSKGLDLAFLLINEKPIAYDLGLLSGDVLRECRIAYHHEFKRISPGVLLRSWVIQTTIENTRLKRLEFGGSRHIDKHEFANLKDSGFQLTLYGSSLKAALLYNFRRQFGRYYEFPGSHRNLDGDPGEGERPVSPSPGPKPGNRMSDVSQETPRKDIVTKYSTEEGFDSSLNSPRGVFWFAWR